MATVQDAINYARAQAQTDSNGLTDAKGIIFANESLVDFHRKLIKGGIDASQIQEAYRDASVPDAGNGSTFLYPTDMAFLKTIEVNYTNTDAQNYILATQVDVSNLVGQNSFSWLRANGNTRAPQFDDRGDWFEIFPTFQGGNNLSQAIRIMYYLKPTEFTSVADTIAYPALLDYRILGWRIASNYKRSLADFISGDAFNLEYEERVQDLIATLSRGAQQPLQATTINLTGWEF